jgi:hypothetical protein
MFGGNYFAVGTFAGFGTFTGSLRPPTITLPTTATIADVTTGIAVGIVQTTSDLQATSSTGDITSVVTTVLITPLVTTATILTVDLGG